MRHFQIAPSDKPGRGVAFFRNGFLCHVSYSPPLQHTTETHTRHFRVLFLSPARLPRLWFAQLSILPLIYELAGDKGSGVVQEQHYDEPSGSCCGSFLPFI